MVEKKETKVKRKGAQPKTAAKEVKTTQAAAAPAEKDIGKASPQPKSTPQKLVLGTSYPKHAELSRWKLVDASGLPLGRLSTVVATMLMGKDKPSYTRHADTGDFVVVINAEKVVLTGNKWKNKLYHHHTNYPGGIKTYSAEFIRNTHPERLIKRAVHGMLPKGHMGRRWYKKLRVFVGPDHTHQAQKPEKVNLPAFSVSA